LTTSPPPDPDRPRVRIYQIFYDNRTRRLIDPAFVPLDNRANERPDWAEYWPIRRACASESFEDVDLLGFFSPRFREKTGLTGRQVMGHLAAGGAEVHSFSPFIEQSALYRSPFEQGDAHHPGLTAVATELLPRLGMTLDLGSLVADQTTTIFANYFVAPVWLWNAWLAAADSVFALCEAGVGPLAEALNATTRHRGPGYPMKVFVMERLITLLLESRGLAALPHVDPRSAPRSLPDTDLVIDGLLACDKLKADFRRTDDPIHLTLFLDLRRTIVATLNALAAEREIANRAAVAAAREAMARRAHRHPGSRGFGRKATAEPATKP
jgi:hypothetical protein